MYVTWLKKKKLGFTLSSRTRKLPHTSSCSTALPKTSPSRLRRVRKSFCKRILGLSNSLCMWIQDFLSNCPQTVRLGPTPLFYYVPQHQCTPRLCAESFTLLPLSHRLHLHTSYAIIKFADDTTTVGLISHRDETAYMDQVCNLTRWCTENNLTLHIKKTEELILNFRRHSENISPLTIRGEVVDRVSSFKYSGVHISENLTRTVITPALVKKKGSTAALLPKDT